jgi:hypothetical protein
MRIPYLSSLVIRLPDAILKICLPGFAGLKLVRYMYATPSSLLLMYIRSQGCAEQVNSAIERKNTNMSSIAEGKPNFLDLLIKPSHEQKKIPLDRDNLVNHALGLFAAGVDTVSVASTVAIYNVLSYPEIQQKLCSEIRQAALFLGDNLDWQKVRRLPYLVCTLPIIPPCALMAKNQSDGHH